MSAEARILVSVMLAALLSGCGHSAPSQGAVSRPGTSLERQARSRDFAYLSEGAFPAVSALPAPPAAGSDLLRQELGQLLSLQSSRTAADCARANSEVPKSLEAFFGPAYGPLTEAEVTRWNPFFSDIAKDTNAIVRRQKELWNRPRPFMEDAAISPCVPLDTSGSYPSGHAALARVYADVLMRLDPGLEGRIDQRADQIAEDRVLGGVHHPSDIAAGKALGDEIFRALEGSPAFERDIGDNSRK